MSQTKMTFSSTQLPHIWTFPKKPSPPQIRSTNSHEIIANYRCRTSRHTKKESVSSTKLIERVMTAIKSASTHSHPAHNLPQKSKIISLKLHQIIQLLLNTMKRRNIKHFYKRIQIRLAPIQLNSLSLDNFLFYFITKRIYMKILFWFQFFFV